MNENSQLAFLNKELDGLVSRFKADRDRHKQTALWVKLMTALLAALAMIALGIQGVATQELLKNVALVLNAAITVFAAYEVFFEPRKLWVRETIVLSKLRDIQRDLKYDLAKDSNMSDEKLSAYKEAINRILKDSLDDWVKDKAVT
jgi:predicted membrane chloride channel (bestrophin family)